MQTAAQTDRRVLRSQYVFMDMATYEETRVPRDDDWAKYMKEGMEVSRVTSSVSNQSGLLGSLLTRTQRSGSIARFASLGPAPPRRSMHRSGHPLHDPGCRALCSSCCR